ncbi:MAG: BMP family ABC transporter substrate-binding protein [Chloroflexota bacterium]|nr:BMP family ABC transporter substrate-binding protein [Chloroflexota bacterium]
MSDGLRNREQDAIGEALGARTSRRVVVRNAVVGGLAVTVFGRREAFAQDTSPAAGGEPIKVAFVYVSPVGDLGWTWAHDQGRQGLERNLPNVETSFQESVPENPADAERVIRNFAQQGNRVVFTCSFGYMRPTINVAQDFPETIFVHISGFMTAENVGTGFGKIEEPRYVSGLIAGRMTTSNRLGYVAAFPIPEVIRGINAFALGVRSVNPAATVQVVWTNTWFGPPQERAAAEALLDGGADVIAQHQDTAGPQQAAQDRGAYGVGYNADMSQQAPEAVLTSPIWHWDIFYTRTVQQVLDGTWETSQYWGGWQDGIVDLAPIGAMVPAEVRGEAEAEIARFKSGEKDIFAIFTGPINDQSGSEKVPAGTALTAEQLLGEEMNWFVEGVEGNPQP